MKFINLLILLIALLVHCIGDSREELQKELDRIQKETDLTLQNDRDLLKSFQKESYQFSSYSKTKEEAIQNYLKYLSNNTKNREENPFAFNRIELREILYPNTLGFGTSLDNSPLKDYEDLVWERRKIGEQKILELLESGKWKLIKINWITKPRQFKVLRGFKPQSVEVSIYGKTHVISQIKQVIEHNGMFKVAIIAP
jgi:hypothetical protein